MFLFILKPLSVSFCPKVKEQVSSRLTCLWRFLLDLYQTNNMDDCVYIAPFPFIFTHVTSALTNARQFKLWKKNTTKHVRPPDSASNVGEGTSDQQAMSANSLGLNPTEWLPAIWHHQCFNEQLKSVHDDTQFSEGDMDSLSSLKP